MKRLRLKNNVLTTESKYTNGAGEYSVCGLNVHPELIRCIHSSLVEPIPDDEAELVPGQQYVVDEVGHGLHGQTVTFRSYQKPRANLVGGYSCEALSLKPLPKLSPVEEVLTRYGFNRLPDPDVGIYVIKSPIWIQHSVKSNRLVIGENAIPQCLYDTPEKLETILKLMGLNPVEAK